MKLLNVDAENPLQFYLSRNTQITRKDHFFRLSRHEALELVNSLTISNLRTFRAIRVVREPNTTPSIHGQTAWDAFSRSPGRILPLRERFVSGQFNSIKYRIII